MPISLDAIDRKILQALQDDGRLTNVELADRVGLSPSPCLRRVKRLEQEGVIRGYRAVIDRNAVSLGLTIFTEIKVDRHTRARADALQAALMAIPQVVSCHMVSGAPDFIAEVVVPDLAAYEALLSNVLLELPMVEDIRSNFSMRAVKTDSALPLPQE
ncbi:Lrp/AsnC family transcriptional regulator [Nitratireductor soli]|uniref:Lrp/AsnC family transcriptional regulator n=1 Tax=Nitratireductor soli TaxID=1670619 RepID=UPI00065E4788|nr:Lrp/AsnC family transcriptional regulator [Nitratireductor soli]